MNASKGIDSVSNLRWLLKAPPPPLLGEVRALTDRCFSRASDCSISHTEEIDCESLSFKRQTLREKLTATNDASIDNICC